MGLNHRGLLTILSALHRPGGEGLGEPIIIKARAVFCPMILMQRPDPFPYIKAAHP